MAEGPMDTYPTLVDRLTSIRAGKEKVGETSNTMVPSAPRDLGLSHRGPDILQDKIDRFLQTEIIPIKIRQDLANLPEVTTHLKALKEDFQDDEYIKLPSVTLMRMTNKDVASLGRYVIPMLGSGFNPQGVAALFLLTYHLRDPGNEDDYVIDSSEGLDSLDDSPYNDFPEEFLSANKIFEPLPEIEDEAAEAQAYSFIASSTLRLFTKSEENYMKAFNHIQQGYLKFYGKNMPVNLPNPSPDAIKALVHYLQHNAKIRATLYKILYLGSATKGEGLRHFLYEMHLTNTGLHIIGIFTRLCIRLNCDPALLLSGIYTAEWSRQVYALAKVMLLIGNPNPKYARRMWRFGRLFDNSFFATLQTKACPLLVYVLAYALKSEAPKTNENILNIVQFADVAADKRRICEAIAMKLVSTIRKSLAAEGGDSPISALLI